MGTYFVMLNLPGDEGITSKNNSVNTHGFEIFEIGNGVDYVM